MRTFPHLSRRCRALLWASFTAALLFCVVWTTLLISVISCGTEFAPASSNLQSPPPLQAQTQPPSHNTYIIRVERRNWPEQDRRELFDAWVGVARSMGYEPTLIVK